jgi:hypothetical protein
MSKFDRFTRALAFANFFQAFRVIVVDAESLAPGQHCQHFSCSTGNQNCPSTCFCNTNQNKCVAHK